MSKLRTGLLATGLAFGWLGCGDEIHYGGSDAAKGDPGVAGPAGGKGDKGDKGDPGAPATTNDHFMFQPKGTLQGVVYDQYDRKPIAGARIHLNYLGMGMVTTVTTGSDGTYAFAGVPATAATGITHPTAGAMWMGVYSVVLELPDPTGAMDRQYRKYQERKAAVVFTDLGDGESAAGSDQNTDTQVDGLVANLDFPVRQLRAAVGGNVYNAEDRSPMANFPMLLTYANGADNNGTNMAVPCPGTDQSAAGQTASNVTTDAMGAYMASGFEEGVCYTLRPVDDRYSFGGASVNPQGRYTGTPFYAPENGVVRRLSDILVQNNVGRDSVAPYVVTVTPGDESVQLAGAALDGNITITFNEAMDLTKQANLATSLYWGLNDSGDRTFPCRGVNNDNGVSNNGQWTTVGGTTSPATVGQKCRTLQEISTVASWDTAGRVLTVNPNVNFVPGLAYAYRLDLHNALLTDVAGNQRTGILPASSTSTAGDAFRAGGGLGCVVATGVGCAYDSVVYTFQAGANPLTVDACVTDPMTGAQTGLCQEPDTADNKAVGMAGFPATRAGVIERRPGVTDHSFLDLLTGTGNGMYNVNAASPQADATNNAYVRWTPVAGAVAYIMYFRSALYPNPQPLQRVFGGSPPRYATNIALGGINAIMGMIYPDNPNTPAINEAFIAINGQWDNNLGFELGLSAVNVDGDEGAIQFLAVKDNTTPEMANKNGAAWPLGADWDYVTGAPAAGTNDSIELNNAQWTGCTTASAAGMTFGLDRRITCQAVAQTNYHSLLATGYGNGTVILQLSEPVSAASIVATNFAYQNGFVRNAIGNTTDVNGAEADPTITGVAPVNAGQGKTTVVAIGLSNIFQVDSGDWIALTGSGGSIADLAGNAANAARSSLANAEAPSFKFVDRIPPMIRNVTLTPSATAAAAGDTISVVFTKRVFLEDDANGANGNYDPANIVLADAAGCTSARMGAVAAPCFFADLTDATATAGNGTPLQSLTLATSAAGDDTVTITVADLSWLNDASRIKLGNVNNIDFDRQTPAGVASRPAAAGDDGTDAYVNIPIDVGAPGVIAAGAYAPAASGNGTRHTQADNIGPRLSMVDADRGDAATQPGGNVVALACPPVAGPAPAPIDVVYRVYLTDNVRRDSAAQAASATNPANWAIVGRDLGGCAAAAGGATPACAASAWNGNTTGLGAAAGTPDNGTIAIQSVTCTDAAGAVASFCALTIRFTSTQTTALSGGLPAGGDCSQNNVANAVPTTRQFAVDSITLQPATTDDQGNAATVGGRTWTFSSNRNAAAQVVSENAGAADGWIRS